MEKDNLRNEVDLNSSEFQALSCRAYAGDAEAQHQAGVLLTQAGCREEGKEWLQKALKAGYRRAAVEVAAFLQEDGKPIAAADLLKEVAEEVPEAKTSLAYCYLKGLGVGKDPEKAEQLLMEIAQSGDGEAKLALARRYKYGDCVPRSFGRAMNWLGRAIEAGCENAMDRYYAEEIAAENRRRQLEEELKRAESGDVDAIISVAEREEDPDLKQKWYLKAAELGSAEVQYWVGEHIEDELIRMEWMNKAGEQGLAKAQVWLGKCCQKDEDYDAAADWYRKAAEQGDPEGQNRLAVCYYNGWGVESDFTAAAEWFEKAAAQGHAPAQYNLGQCYHYGYGVEKDENVALEYYRKAANQNYTLACRALGNYYDSLPLPERDYVTAADWYHKAAAQGDAESQFMLGLYYSNGRGVDPDEVSAARWYTRAAEQGHAKAQNNLGVCYRTGAGVEKSLSAAVEWYRKSAEQGEAVAQSNLAGCYYDGEGVQKSFAAAAEWYQKSAEQGCAEGQYGLGRCYQNGAGVKKDAILAVKWYQKAAEQEHKKAKDVLREEWAKPFNIQWEDPAAVCRLAKRLLEETGIKDTAAAVQYFNIAAEQGDTEAQYCLGSCYENGTGVVRDVERAAEWYLKAAESGHASAQYRLGRCLFDGKGVKKDAFAAVSWYEKAAVQGNAAARFRLGECYYKGIVVTRDAAKAAEWLRKAAEQNDKDAMHLLGKCYEEGFGVEKSRSEADRWYLKAGTLSSDDRRLLERADIGESEAQYKLGLRYLAEEPEVGIRLLEQAAEKNNTDAMTKLGEIAFDAKDYDKAKEWYRKSGKGAADLWVDAKRGDAEAQFLYAKQAPAYYEAKEYYHLAAAQGHTEAMKWVEENNRRLAEEKAERERKQALEKKREKAFRRKERVAKVTDPLLCTAYVIMLIFFAFLAVRALFVPGRFGYVDLGAMVVVQLLMVAAVVLLRSPPDWLLKNNWRKPLGAIWTVSALGMLIQLVFRMHNLSGERMTLYIVVLVVSVAGIVFWWHPTKKKKDDKTKTGKK